MVRTSCQSHANAVHSLDEENQKLMKEMGIIDAMENTIRTSSEESTKTTLTKVVDVITGKTTDLPFSVREF